jgi:hypothetical protein
MVTLHDALRAWPTPDFAPVLKRELAALPPGVLPLQHGVSPGTHVDDSEVSAMVIRAAAETGVIRARVGVFFTEVLAGCSCCDDPAPASAYCEIEVLIEPATGEARFVPVRD